VTPEEENADVIDDSEAGRCDRVESAPRIAMVGDKM